MNEQHIKSNQIKNLPSYVLVVLTVAGFYEVCIAHESAFYSDSCLQTTLFLGRILSTEFPDVSRGPRIQIVFWIRRHERGRGRRKESEGTAHGGGKGGGLRRRGKEGLARNLRGAREGRVAVALGPWGCTRPRSALLDYYGFGLKSAPESLAVLLNMFPRIRCSSEA